jgi:hypothetical protein
MQIEKLGSSQGKKMKSSTSFDQSLDVFLTKLLRWWGVLFRALFIGAVGFFVWVWIGPESIVDVPIAQLTLGKLFKNLLAVFVALGCMGWLFTPPESDGKKDPFTQWGEWGLYVIFLAGAWYCWRYGI